MSHRPAGFSLTELLVVIAIISALAAILLPSVERSLSEAKLVGCMNTQRQCYLGIQSYSEISSFRAPDWNGHWGWSPMVSISDPYNKSAQLGRVISAGLLERELMLDPGLVNRDTSNHTATAYCILSPTGTLRWNYLNAPTAYTLAQNWASASYAMYLWNGSFATVRKLNQPIAYTSALTMCRIEPLSRNLECHDRRDVNAIYLDGHGRRLPGVMDTILSNGVCSDSLTNGNASSFPGYSWWNWARDLDKK